MEPTPPADDGRMRRPLGRKVRVDRRQSSLVAWIAGLPWVEEVGGRSPARPVRRFDIQCPLLGVKAEWAVVTGEPGRPDLAVQLVVPQILWQVVDGVGWFTDVTPLSAEAYLARVNLVDRTPVELQVVVLSAYGFMFPPLWPSHDEGAHRDSS